MRSRATIYSILIVFLAACIALTLALQSSAVTGPTQLGAEPPAMTEINRIRLQESDWRTDAAAKKKYVQVSLTNVSQDMVWTPIKVVIDTISDANASVTNADGLEGGLPYFRYLEPATLGPGETTPSREWEFSYASPAWRLGPPLSFTTRVFVCTDADYDGFFAEADCGTEPDCDDHDPAINPDATEVCDGADNNCNGEIDEGVKTTFYPDYDGDGHGDAPGAHEACSPLHHDVLIGDDCDDANPDWWLGNDQGECVFAGFTDCYSPYEQTCNPAISGVESKLISLNEHSPFEIDVKEDKFGWEGFEAPGGVLGARKKHLQSIQYFSRPGLDGSPDEPFLVVTMSDESESDYASISIVDIGLVGLEGGTLDRVVAQFPLNMYSQTGEYNHAGGAQLIGAYLFVALEDFEGDVHGDPRVSIWHINRNESPDPPILVYMDAFDAMDGDSHHTAVGVTKMRDGSYLVAACVIGGCDTIRFFKSEPGVELLHWRPEFRPIYQWGRSELIAEPGEEAWSDCDPQNLNLVVDAADGAIYAVMFGVKRTDACDDLGSVLSKGCGNGCGTAACDDFIYVYKLAMTETYEIQLEFVAKVDIGTGDACDLGVGATGTNFEAGSGLWIGPGGRDTIALLATEHYDSCGDPGKSRWGVTENWSD